MLRSVLHRQRFHTQDEREMNTEDAGGDMGALTTPATATLTASLHPAGSWGESKRRRWDWGLETITDLHRYEQSGEAEEVVFGKNTSYYLT